MYRFLSFTVLIIFCLVACQTAKPTADDLATTLTAIPVAPALDNEPVIAIETATANLPTPTAQPTHTSTPTPIPTPSFPQFTGSEPIERQKIGIQVHPYGEDQDAIIDNLTALGVGWVKIQVSWKLFQPGPDRLDEFWFSEAERFINMANDQDIKVLIGIAKAPEWSRPMTDEDGPPSDLTHFTEFTALLAERFSGKVDAWEIWNESNLRREWNGAPLNGGEFTKLVKAGGDGIRAVDPTVILISGAPAPTGINDGVNAIDDRVYFEQMLAAGIAQHIDGIGYHPYSGSNPVWGKMGDTADYAISHNDHPSFFFSHTTSDYLALMEQYAVDLPLWGTEFGWGSYENLGKPAPVGVEYMDQINEWQQAENVVDVFIFANENKNIGPMFVWNLNFGPLLGPDFAEAGYGILRPDGSKRPVWYTLQNMPKH
jgi:hypothetical protein